MASTYSPLLRINLQGTGDNANTWGAFLNTDFNLVEAAIAGVVTITASAANTSLTQANGTTDQERMATLYVNGSPGATRSLIVTDDLTKIYVVSNQTSDSSNIVLRHQTGTGVTVAPGQTLQAQCFGTTVVAISPNPVVAVSAGTYGSNNELTQVIVNAQGFITSIVHGTSVVPQTTKVSAGTGLSGGGALTADVSISLANTSVTPGTYTNSTITVDQQGRITEASSGASFDIPYVLIQEQKTDGTDAGATSSGAWTARGVALTEVTDTGGHASVSAGTFTLAAGTWDIVLRVPFYNVGSARTRLYNTTDATAVSNFLSETYYDTGNNLYFNTMKYIETCNRLVLAAQKTFQVEYYTNAAVANGLGINDGFTAGTEIYMTIQASKVA